jgi:hypothetical protein
MPQVNGQPASGKRGDQTAGARRRGGLAVQQGFDAFGKHQ